MVHHLQRHEMGYIATTDDATPKEGKACAQTILGLVATGDASISEAKTAGGITQVAHIDYSAHSILGVVADFCRRSHRLTASQADDAEAQSSEGQ
jgi:hypothetical protein